MSSLTNIKNEGYFLLDSWSFTITATGKTGTRLYLETEEDDSIPTSTKVTLPIVGDPWDDDNQDTVCKSLQLNYLSKETCGRKILATYGPKSITMDSTPSSVDDLPKYVDVSGEILYWEPEGDTYYWENDSQVFTKQPLSKLINYVTIRVYRVIKTFNAYMQTLNAAMNKTNSGEFLGYPAGMVLFTGGNLSEFRNRFGEKRWTVELVFQVRSVTGVNAAASDGWNFEYRKDKAEWDRPIVYDTGLTLYQENSFEDLFNSDPLGDDEVLPESFPSQ